MRDNSDNDNFRVLIKDIKRQQARNGLFSEMPEYEALCLSKGGWTPAGCLAACSAYANSVVLARDEFDVAQKHRTFWEASLKSVEPDAGGGAPTIRVTIASWAAGRDMDSTSLLCAAQDLA